MLVKELALVDPEDCVPVGSLKLRMLPFLTADVPMCAPRDSALAM
jgi:hypothetical protein